MSLALLSQSPPGDGAAQKGLKLAVGDIVHLAQVVAGQLLFLIGDLSAGALHLHLCLQGQAGGVGAHGNGVAAPLHLPAVGVHVEVAEGLVVQGDGDPARLSRFQGHLGKALQLQGRAEQGAVLHAHIDLGGLGALSVPGIGEGEGDLLLPASRSE